MLFFPTASWKQLYRLFSLPVAPEEVDTRRSTHDPYEAGAELRRRSSDLWYEEGLIYKDDCTWFVCTKFYNFEYMRTQIEACRYHKSYGECLAITF